MQREHKEQKEINERGSTHTITSHLSEEGKRAIDKGWSRNESRIPDEYQDVEKTDPRKYINQSGEDVFGAFDTQISFLKGKVLTVIDASYHDPVQRKAVKDLIHQQFNEQTKHIYELLTGNRMITATGEKSNNKL